ncbi:MAG: hypothetical protein K6G51_05275 [Sphaerochaetaceae bacterium]|nr:hypothetical protein [Sphaerochaetaceae bacterium]
MAKVNFKEGFRKFIVSLKRNTPRIPMCAFLVSFIYYSFNLSCISNTTAKIQGPGMGIYGFITMLFSMLSLVAFINAFPHRKKVNKPMLILMLVLVAFVIFADIQYRGLIYAAVFDPVNPIAVTSSTAYIAEAASVLSTHIVLLIVSIVLTALLPVYSKLLKKINTNIDVDGYGKMEAIEIEHD